MKQPEPNLAASVKQRLLNLATLRREDFNQMQVRYATERLLYRLSVSPYAQQFLLKGATLFVLWEDHPHRPTRDLDLLFLEAYDARALAEIFREIAALPVEADGLVFDERSVQSEGIREENAYGGIRVKLLCYLGTARIPVQVDIGLGDSVYPEPDWQDFATLLEFPAPRIRPYPIESVIAEKLQAMVELGSRNTRMKDFFDLLYLQERFEISGPDLQAAIQRTFQRRRTKIPAAVAGDFDLSFSANPDKQKQWDAFLRKNRLVGIGDFQAVCSRIASFALPAMRPAPLNQNWSPQIGWSG